MDEEPDGRTGEGPAQGLGAAVLGAGLAVLIGLVMVGGLRGAGSWRDGELFLEPGVIALGAIAFVLSVVGLVGGLAAGRPGRRVPPNTAHATALAANTLAVVLACGWLFLVFVSASSD